MPANFTVIAFCQAIIWGIVRILPHTSRLRGWQWARVAVIGTLFGAVLDPLLGAAGLFGYLPQGPGTPAVEAAQLPVYFLFFNAFISYGLVLATTALVSDFFIDNKNEQASLVWNIASGFIACFGIAGIILSPTGSLPMMFSCGLVIVTAGELLLGLYGRNGPLVLLCSGTDYRPFLKLWVFSILIGAGYEIANLFFPFWKWLPGTAIPEMWLQLLIITVGYFALIHPLATLWHLFGRRSKDS